MYNSTLESDGSSPDLSGYAYYSFGLSIGVLLLFAFLTFALYYCSRRNYINETQPTRGSDRSFNLQTIIVGDSSSTNSPRSVGVDDATLKSYPVLLYSEAKHDRKGNSGDSATSCSVCLGDYKDSEWLRVLPDCGHFFHRKCIDMWLRMNTSCPLCRTSPLPTPLLTPLAEVAPLARTRV